MNTTTSKKPKPPIPTATDIVAHIAGKDGSPIPLSYWDVWYVLLAQKEYCSDFERLANTLREMSRESSDIYNDSEMAKAKLNHLRDLQRRLAISEISIEEILEILPPVLKRHEALRASARIIRHTQRSYELSEAMKQDPEKKLLQEALYGKWNDFPVSPQSYYAEIRARFNWDHYYGENASRGVAKKLDTAFFAAGKLEEKEKFAEALAVLRSALTVTLEVIQIADDSYGHIGDSFADIFTYYYELPRDKAGISSELFLADLLELIIFDECGFAYDLTKDFFASLSQAECDFCRTYLLGRISILMSHDLDFQVKYAQKIMESIPKEVKKLVEITHKK